MHKPTCSTEVSDYSLQKYYFFQISIVFLCGVVKKSHKKIKFRQMRQSWSNRSIKEAEKAVKTTRKTRKKVKKKLF